MDIERRPKSYTILVVDDDELIRRVVQKTLANFGYTTATAADGTQALKMAAELRPAIIMVDLHMPGIDGHTIMRRARAQGIDAAFVVISGSKDPEDIIDALRNGASDYLPKPFTVADLIAASGRAIEAFEKKKTQPGPETLAPLAPATAPAKPTPSAVTPAKVIQNHQSVGSAILSRWSVDPTVSMLARVHHGNVLTNPVNAYAVLECVASQAAERLTGAPDATGVPRDAALVQECARRLKTPPLDVLLARIQPTYEAILNTLT